MPDLGHKLTEKELAKLERTIKSVYSEASNDFEKTINDYFSKFKDRDEELRKQIEEGTLQLKGTSANMSPEEYYKQWRLNQIARGERFEAMRDKLAERATAANEVAISYVNDATPGIYSLNRNYAAYTIESVADNVSFTLFDESTVRRLIAEEPETMPFYPPERAVKRGIDLEYGKKQITATVTSGILQGQSIKQLSEGLQARIVDISVTSAIRAARTAVTSAQNGGRQDSYVSAVNMGIRMKKEWMATTDARTRFDHGMADGQKVDVDKPFIVGGEKMMFPGDPKGSGWNVYNCRCTMVSDLLDYPDAKPRESWHSWIDRKSREIEEEIKEDALNSKVTTYEDAIKALTERIGFTSFDDSFKLVDKEIAVENINQLVALENKFGAIHAGDVIIESVNESKSTIAFTSARVTLPSQQKLSLCPRFYSNKKTLLKTGKDDESSFFHMPCNESEISIYTVTHEYGHIVQNLLVRTKFEKDGWTEQNFRQFVNINGKTSKTKYEWYNNRIHEVEKKCYQDIVDIAKANNPDFKISTTTLSKYGHTDYGEFFAECFANSQLGKPNELGNAMNIFLEREGLMR